MYRTASTTRGSASRALEATPGSVGPSLAAPGDSSALDPGAAGASSFAADGAGAAGRSASWRPRDADSGEDELLSDEDRDADDSSDEEDGLVYGEDRWITAANVRLPPLAAAPFMLNLIRLLLQPSEGCEHCASKGWQCLTPMSSGDICAQCKRHGTGTLCLWPPGVVHKLDKWLPASKVQDVQNRFADVGLAGIADASRRVASLVRENNYLLAQIKRTADEPIQDVKVITDRVRWAFTAPDEAV